MKNGNGKTLTVVLSAVALIVGLVVGSMGTWISAGQRFVDRQQYERDLSRMEGKLDRLLQFHMQDRRRP